VARSRLVVLLVALWLPLQSLAGSTVPHLWGAPRLGSDIGLGSEVPCLKCVVSGNHCVICPGCPGSVIVAWAQTRQTNGFLEALNGLFQAAKRRARGFTRMSTIRTVIFLIAGKLDFRVINPHASQPT
jgi:hypothetical protein